MMNVFIFPCHLFVFLLVFQYLFVDSTNNYLWNTFDFCKTVQGFSLPFKPTDLLLHSRRSNLVLGYDGSHPNKQVKAAARHEFPHRQLIEGLFSQWAAQISCQRLKTMYGALRCYVSLPPEGERRRKTPEPEFVKNICAAELRMVWICANARPNHINICPVYQKQLFDLTSMPPMFLFTASLISSRTLNLYTA